MTMCKAAHLSLDALEERRDEIGQTSQAIRRIIVLPEKRTTRRCYFEVAEECVVHSIQMPVRQFFQKQEELGSGAWRGGGSLMHFLQRWHQGVLCVSGQRRLRSLQRQDLWAIVVRVVVRMKHRAFLTGKLVS